MSADRSDESDAPAVAKTRIERGIIRTLEDSDPSAVNGEPEWHSEHWMNVWGSNYRRHVYRERTTYADRVTDWVEHVIPPGSTTSAQPI